MWCGFTYPWQAVEASLESLADFDEKSIQPWSFQIMTQKDTMITNATTGGILPSRKISDTHKVIELPGPVIKGDMSREFVVDINRLNKVSFQYGSNYSKKNYSHRIEQFEPFFDNMVDAMLFLVRECLDVEKYQTKNIYWADILQKMHENENDDPAKYALIVDLARRLIGPLDRITSRPKRILHRVYDQERIQKVQEIDIKCLIDLARRPGTVLTEKAGPKQRILAIKREESTNILENRVTKHCCTLAAQASKRYLHEHKKIKVSKSKRKKSVEKLLSASCRLPEKPSFQEIHNLLEPCRQPNYTLLQNADYYKVWNSYIQLVRNEDIRQNLWKWNRRLWADYMGLFLADLMQTYQKIMTKELIQVIGYKTVLGNRKQDFGTWLFSDTMPGPFILDPHGKKPKTLYLIRGDYDTLSNVYDTLSELSILNADYLLITVCDGNRNVLPIYTIFPSYHLGEGALSQFVDRISASLIKELRAFNKKSNNYHGCGGWVLLGNWFCYPISSQINSQDDELTCWISDVDADYRNWKNMDDSRYEPLMTISRD